MSEETTVVIANPTPEDDQFLRESGDARLAMIWVKLKKIEAKLGELIGQ